MAATFDEIEATLGQLRAFVLDDLERIVSHETGSNYPAVALVVTAYDALADLRGERNWVTFRESLPREWRPVAKSLYGALRNGLIHHYEPKVIVVGDRRVELWLSWRERGHLSLEGPRLYLNVQQMAVALQGAFDDYETALRGDGNLRDRFIQRSAERQVDLRDPVETEAWRSLLSP